MLTFDELRRVNVRRCRETWHHETDWSAADWLGCVLGELGEAAHRLKELRREGVSLAPDPALKPWTADATSLDALEARAAARQDVARELADTLIYLDLLAAACGIDLGEAVRAKFNAVSERVGSGERL